MVFVEEVSKVLTANTKPTITITLKLNIVGHTLNRQILLISQ
jgi:hypothetical protein